ncbi:MAG: cellulose biosynthesis cyclic di-GMP-binding regulatory protein BcsB, partial [Thermomicrobiales bacterium]
MKSSVRVLVVLIAFCGLAAWADSDSKMLAQESTPVLGTPVPDQPIETGANQWYVNDTQMTFAALGYYDRTVTSPEAMLDLYLPLPPGTFPVDYTGLVLNISHSPLLDPDVSTMTVYANDTALTSVFLDESNQAGSALEVALPVGSVGIDGYEIRIEFSLRLTGESCEPVANQALWATVHGDSMFDATRRHDEGTADLSTISDQFVDLAEPITIVLPAAPTAAEFETAGVVAFQIGRWNANDADFPSIVYASVADGLVTGPSIYLGTGSGLADPRSWTGLIWDGSNYSKDGETVNPDHGVLALVQDPNPVLHVSGMTDLALARSVAMLTKDAAAATLRGPLVFATDQVSLEGEGPTAWTGSETTFGDLGIDEQEVRGAGDHTLDLVVRRPSEWIAGNGGNLTVNVLASPSVVPELSSIGVSVNGVRIGSSALTEGVEPGSIVFDLPAEAINAKPGGQLDVRIEVHLELLSGSCRAADPDSAWLRVAPDSSWSIPHASYPDLDLARLPAPFSGQSDTSPFLIVLPDSPSLSDVTAGLHMATAFGQRTG